VTSQPDTPREPDAALELEPTQADIDRWAAEERERREAWLRGPTDAQKAAWAARERMRRAAAHGRWQGRLPLPSADTRRLTQFYMREVQLAAEGAMSLVFSMSVRDVFDSLVQAGREWENEYTRRPPRRRRIRLDDAGENAELHDVDNPPGVPPPAR
jgi:hypothetical protein